MKHIPGLFVTGTDTGVGKTYVAAIIARSLTAAGLRVGVYKPVASGCRLEHGQLVSDDAVALWRAAGSPDDLERVCPQRFAAPLAPHLAARAEGQRLDAARLRTGVDFWRGRSDVIVVEGAGGLMSPLGDDAYVADLARDLGYPLIVVARNTVGVINQTLQTLIAARTFGAGLPIAGIILNRPSSDEDPSQASNFEEIQTRAAAPLLGEVLFGAQDIVPKPDWLMLPWHTKTHPH